MKFDLKEAVIFGLAVIIVIFGFKYYALLHAPHEDNYLDQTKHLRTIIKARIKSGDNHFKKSMEHFAQADTIRAERIKDKPKLHETVTHTRSLNDSLTFQLFLRNYSY